jgi:HAD superfamily hydrolase (TIGR01484 family)
LQSIHELPVEIAKKIRVVTADIDDTISSEGKILPEAYNALWELSKAGIDVVPITGRCAGWVDHIARMWPVRGVVGENGAFYAYMHEEGKVKRLKMRFFLDPDSVKANKEKFEAIKNQVFAKYPTCKVASDQPYRIFDLAIDFCEDVPPLRMEDVKEIVKIYESFGANVKISSIHVNGWFGDYDKLTMTKIFMEEQLGFSIEEHQDYIIFIGDSPNDQPMFKFFKNSVGVKNVENFKTMMTHWPTYVTNHHSGLGFAEMVNVLLEKRKM